MIDRSVLNKAIINHIRWKELLIEAINNGTEGFDVKLIEQDNKCEFGEWLYSLPNEIKENEFYKKICLIHADFHKSAAEILRLIMAGETREAEKSIYFGGNFYVTSNKLMNAINEWKNTISKSE